MVQQNLKFASSREEFVDPKSLDEAYQRRTDLTLRIQDIESQLSRGWRFDPNGQVLTRGAYKTWRNSAIGAKKFISSELLLLKEWIRKEKTRLDEEMRKTRAEEIGIDLEDPDSLIKASYRLLSKLADQGCIVEATDRSIVTCLRHYVSEKVAATSVS